MTGLVLDASVTVAWCFDDEDREALEVLSLATTASFHVPAIWPFEVGNALAVAERRRRLKPAEGARFLELLSSLPVEVEPVPAGVAIRALLDLSRATGLSVYDAAYLELAQRSGRPLATIDVALARAARSAGVRLVTSS